MLSPLGQSNRLVSSPKQRRSDNQILILAASFLKSVMGIISVSYDVKRMITVQVNESI